MNATSHRNGPNTQQVNGIGASGVAADNVGMAVRGLVKRYETFTVDRVDLTVPRGSVMALVGANGSGKTTTIRSALGATVAEAGQVAMPPMEKVGVALDSNYFPTW